MTGSPYYWGFVVAVTLVFAAIDVEALRRRSMSRFHGASVAAYLCVWVLVAGLSWSPVGSLWLVFPIAIRIAVMAMFAGGQLLADAIREEQLVVHPERRPPEIHRREISRTELSAGEAFDAQWQIEDRERNRERRLQAKLDRERLRRHLHDA